MTLEIECGARAGNRVLDRWKERVRETAETSSYDGQTWKPHSDIVFRPQKAVSSHSCCGNATFVILFRKHATSIERSILPNLKRLLSDSCTLMKNCTS
jgi:hypothetical protein